VARLQKMIGRQVTVQGKVVRSEWSGSGKVLNIELAGPDESRVQAYLFSDDRDAFDAAFGGDAAAATRRQMILLSGKLERYGGKVEAWRNRLQIYLDRPDQITIVRGQGTASGPTATTTRPASAATRPVPTTGATPKN
jgi:hypothetical protein